MRKNFGNDKKCLEYKYRNNKGRSVKSASKLSKIYFRLFKMRQK